MRSLFSVLHRWAGLFMAVFLAIAGLTGSVIAWEGELDRWLNPQLFVAQSSRDGATPVALPATEVARRVEAADPRLLISFMPLAATPGGTLLMAVEPRIDPATGQRFVLGFDQIAVDPVTAQVQGTRTWGRASLSREHVIPFLYKLHHTLFLPRLWGVDWAVWFLGGVAMLWTLDCFIALVLAFPRRVSWRKSFAFRFARGAKALNFDLHRSGGVWTWALMLVLAVTSVAMNLYDEVMEPLVSVVSRVSPSPFDARTPLPPPQRRAPTVSRAELVALAAAEGRRRGWADAPGHLSLRSAFDLYAVDFYTVGVERPGLGPPRLYFDAHSGALAGDRVPGAGTAGDLFMRLQFPLHSGRIAGPAGRALVSVLGVAITVLSVTGVVLWLTRRRARRAGARLRAGSAPAR